MKPNYLRMIERMPVLGKKEWCVYILRCGDGTLYTGIAKDAQARFARHQAGKGAAYTRSHPPVALLYKEGELSRSEALRREAAIKRLSRLHKEKLIITLPAGRQVH